MALAIIFVASFLLILAALLWARKRRGGEPGTAPGWAFRPPTGWLYLVVYVASFLIADSGGVHSTLQVLGALILVGTFLTSMVFVFRDRSERSERALWWVLATYLGGPIAYLVYVYQRRKRVGQEATEVVRAPG